MKHLVENVERALSRRHNDGTRFLEQIGPDCSSFDRAVRVEAHVDPLSKPRAVMIAQSLRIAKSFLVGMRVEMRVTATATVRVSA